MGVYVNNHVVYGDCEMLFDEHWSWTTTDINRKLKQIM